MWTTQPTISDYWRKRGFPWRVTDGKRSGHFKTSPAANESRDALNMSARGEKPPPKTVLAL